MAEHLVENNSTNNSQHGCMTNTCCLTNLLEFLDFITKVEAYGALLYM